MISQTTSNPCSISQWAALEARKEELRAMARHTTAAATKADEDATKAAGKLESAKQREGAAKRRSDEALRLHHHHVQ